MCQHIRYLSSARSEVTGRTEHHSLTAVITMLFPVMKHAVVVVSVALSVSRTVVTFRIRYHLAAQHK
jgi:hypothetical protein